MEKSPKLTIVMPFFNNPTLVVEMMESIVENDFQDWELLAVDDGSTEQSLEYIKSRVTDARVRIIHRYQEPKGPQTCRNIGIKEMRGDFVIFFDSDDYVTPSCLRVRVQELQKRPDLDFMVFPTGVFVDGRFDPNAPKYIFGYPVNSDDTAALAKRELPFVVCSNIYRARSIVAHGMEWDTSLLSLQDADFNMQALTKGMKYAYANVKADYGYRIFTGGASVSRQINTYKHFDSHLYATRRFFEMLQAKHGHKYDWDIFQGVLFLYNNVFTNGIDKDYALRMAKNIKKYNKTLYFTLKLQVEATILLAKFLPPKRARQIPMALYLVAHIARMKLKRRRMKPL